MQPGDAGLATLECQRSVRFSLLADLFASGSRASSWHEDLPYGLTSAGAHLGVLLSVAFMLAGRSATEPASETATYLDIPPPPVAESPRATLPPRPPVVRQGLQIPAELPQVLQPGKLAGFQELLAPARMSGLPTVGSAEAPVNPLDYQGRGIAGGVAGGEKPKEIPPPTDSTPLPMEEGAAVDIKYASEPPVLQNRAELLATLQDLYPPLLRAAGIEGTVQVEFVVATTGRVDPGTVRIRSSPNPALSDATRTALARFRFSPGRIFHGGEMRLVPVWTQMSIAWTLSVGGPR